MDDSTRTVATGTRCADYGKPWADVLAVCVCPRARALVGSLVVGKRDAIAEARVWRKDGRRHAAGRDPGRRGLHALDHHLERLADDHAHARLLAEACGVDPATVDNVDTARGVAA